MDNDNNKISIHFGPGRRHDMHDRHHRHNHHDRHHRHEHHGPHGHIGLHVNWVQMIIIVAIFISVFVSAIFFFNRSMVENSMNSVKHTYNLYLDNSHNDQYIKSVKIKSIEKDNNSQRYYFTYETDADWANRIFYGSSRYMFTEDTIKSYKVGDYVEVVLDFPTPLRATQAIPTNKLNTSYTEDGEYIVVLAQYNKLTSNLKISITCAIVSIIVMIVYSIILHNKNKTTDEEKVTSSIDENQSKPSFKNCNYCGKKNESSNTFCSSCGARLD